MYVRYDMYANLMRNKQADWTVFHSTVFSVPAVCFAVDVVVTGAMEEGTPGEVFTSFAILVVGGATAPQQKLTSSWFRPLPPGVKAEKGFLEGNGKEKAVEHSRSVRE